MNDLNDYRAWRRERRANAGATGFDVDPSDLHPKLRDDQRAIVAWSLRRGHAAQFINTGGGKAFNILEWSHHVARRTGRRVLLLAPLAVADQHVETEAPKWGYTLRYVRNQDSACPSLFVPPLRMRNFVPIAHDSAAVCRANRRVIVG